MKDKLLKFINIINDFDNTDDKRNELKQYICFFAEKLEQQFIETNDSAKLSQPEIALVKQLIKIGSDKLKVFGYPSMAKIDIQSEFATDIAADAIKNYHVSTIKQGDKDSEYLDGLQKNIIDTYLKLETKRIFVSAPTSFGKSYILQEILKGSSYTNVMFVLPTVALLTEFTNKFSRLKSLGNFDHKIITTNYDDAYADKNMFIFTPERAVKFIGKSSLTIDFFFFDEVYKIDDGVQISECDNNDNIPKERPTADNRTIAFRTCLYLLSKRCKDYYIAGPFINLSNKDNGLSKFIASNSIKTFATNFDPTLRIMYDAFDNNEIIEHNPILGKLPHPLKIQKKGTSPKQSEVFLRVKNFIDNNKFGKSIVYLQNPSTVIKVVGECKDKFRDRIDITDKLSAFIEHLKNKYNAQYTIHEHDISSVDYWSLAICLSQGIGIHHGKIPKYIQNEILRQFDVSDMRYLFCTSTITEGINTTAKNVIMLSSSSSRDKGEIKIFAQKNIKGRAGRYYKNFVGRVFYCNKKQASCEKGRSADEGVTLDFINYNDAKLTAIDLDITDSSDLSTNNQQLQKKRESKYDREKLPDNIYKQNILFDRLMQQDILDNLLDKNIFNRLYKFIQDISNDNYAFNNLLFEIIKIIAPILEPTTSDKAINRVIAIIQKYSNGQFASLLKYHLGEMSKDSNYKDIDNIKKDIDSKYNAVFHDIRTIIEYDVPKYISLFQSLFFRACQIKNKVFGESDLESFIQQFEIGTRSSFGQFLIERGFPNTSISTVESELQKNNIDSNKIDESIKFVMDNNYKLEALDKYENIKLREICEQNI